MDGPSLWRLTLDQDLLDTLTRRFPSWFDNLSSTTGDSFQTSAEKYFTVNLADINGMAEGMYCFLRGHLNSAHSF